MLSAIALALLTFPGEPLADQVAEGVKIARSELRLKFDDLFRSPQPSRSLRSIWQDDVQVVGTWSNGYTKIGVETVTWVSPSLVSRWLGFLSAREYWQESELQQRWERVSTSIGPSRLFVVQLSAYPKIPTYGVGDYVRTTPEEIEDVRFVYTSGDKSLRMEAERIAQWQSREKAELDGFLWWRYVRFGRYLSPEFESYDFQEPLPLGDYHRAWYLVSVPDSGDEKFEVRVLSRRKERVARFNASK